MGNNKIQSSSKIKAGHYYFCAFLLILLFVFRSLLTNIETHLIDWRDYPYYVWVMFQNINHIKAFDFGNLFNTNAFYPYTHTLLLSDTLLPQSIMAIPFSFFSNNPILIFNLTFLLNFVFNYLASYKFWGLIFKKKILAFFGGFATVFSPFLFIELNHFQMMSYWPFFLGLYFFMKNEKSFTRRNNFLAGFFLAIQFLASVYHAFFLTLAFIAHSATKILLKSNYKLVLKKLLYVFVVFFIFSGVFIKGYFETKEIFSIQRSYGEYVTYSAHISDYLFSNQINSLLHNLNLITKWNSFNKHIGAVFPGFLLSVTLVLSLISIKRQEGKVVIKINLNRKSLFFLALLALGFIFSLGPRANFNGSYAEFPLPYALVLKFPFIDLVRATSRWSFLFYTSLIYFLLHFASNKSKTLLAILFLVFFLEYLPTGIQVEKESYLSHSDTVLKEVCRKEKTVVLEIPVTHFEGKADIAEGLSYVTKNQLATLETNCALVNGYSGYDPIHLGEIANTLSLARKEMDLSQLKALLIKYEIDYIVVNLDRYEKTELEQMTSLVELIKEEIDFEQIENSSVFRYK